MDTMLMNILSELLKLVLIVAAGFVVALIKRSLGTEKMKRLTEELENKREIVETVVLFVQQVYAHYDGEEKFAKAFERVAERLNEAGLKTSPAEIEDLIESSIKLFKKEFGDSWYGAITYDTLVEG